MGIFSKKFRAEETLEKIERCDTRLELLDEAQEFIEGSTEELFEDVRDILVKTDSIDEDFVECVPVLKKYGTKLGVLMRIIFKSSRIEIKKINELEKQNEKLESAVTAMEKEMETQNKILERIAKAIEAKK